MFCPGVPLAPPAFPAARIGPVPGWPERPRWPCGSNLGVLRLRTESPMARKRQAGQLRRAHAVVAFGLPPPALYAKKLT